MKKKLIQILMLLVVAVSMGAFVSCKDTNDDLRNEFAQALGQSTANKTVWETLEEQEALLNILRQQYGDALENLKSCECDESGLKNQLTKLERVVDDLNALINGSSSSGGDSGSGIIDIIDDYIETITPGGAGGALQDIINQVLIQGGDIDDILNQIAQITNILGGIDEQSNNITILFANAETAKQQLEGAIARLDALEAVVAQIHSCECNINEVWDAIHTLQSGLTEVQATATQALALATSADSKADAAQTTANTAKLTAEEAKTAAAAATQTANAATAAAQAAAEIAANAQTIATQAGLDAQDAKTFAEAAKQTAKDAIDLANQAISDAAAAQALAGANKEAIEALKTDIQTIQSTLTQYGTQISDNTAAIQKNAQDIATNVSNIQANAEAIQQNKNAIDAINIQITTLSSDVAQALQDAAAANALATTNAAAIENIKSDVSANKTAIDSLKLVTKELKSDITELTTKLNDLTNQVNTNTTNITNLTNRIEEVNTNLTNSITTINANITEMQTTLANHEQKLTDMATELAAAKAECAANLVLAKQYAEQQAEAVRTALQAEINNLIAQLANYALKNDVYTKEEVDSLLKDLKDELKVTIDNNTARIEVLEGKITVLDDYGTRITALETKLGSYETLVTTVDGHTTAINNLTTDLSALTSVVDGLSTTVGGLSTTVSDLLTTVGENTSAIEAINALLATIQSCACDTAALNESINGILDRLATAESSIANNADSIAANKELINQINEALTNLINEQITNLQNQIDAVDGKVDAVDGKIDALQLAFDNLNYITPEEVDNKLSTLSESLIGLINAEKLAREQADENLQNQIDSIKQAVTDAVTRIAANEVAIAALEASKVNVSDYEADKADILSKIDANTTKIGDLQDAVDAINDDLDALKDEVDDLKTRMDNAETNLANAMQDIQEIKSDVAAIQDYLAKQVTSIMVQGTYNPWYGTFNLPFDVQSNVLVAFYGKPTTDVVFPTSRTANYVRAEEALTEKDMEMLGLSEEDPLFDYPANVPLMYTNGYAGKIYMTINPNTADVTGLQPVIVNSLDEESYITLTPIKPSAARLQFGFTRAGQSSNGFYEAEAQVTANNVQKINSPTLETGAISDAMSAAREAIEAIAKEQSITGTGAGAKLERIASDINKIVSGLRFDRSGLKCSYVTQEADGTEKEHSVYSQYNLAATAFKPLSLETAKDFHYATIPGYEKVNALLDKLSNKVHEKVHVFFKDLNESALIEKIVNLKIKDISVPDLSDDLLAKFILHMDTTFVMDGLSYHLQMPVDVNVPVKFEKDLEIPVNLDDVSVSVPIHIEQDVSVDLSDVYIETPTVVIAGSGGIYSIDENGDTIRAVQDNEGGWVTELIIPVLDNNNVVQGYTTIPLDNFVITFEGDNVGNGAGKVIYLNGTPIAHVVIDETIDTEVDIHDTVTYHLVIEDTFATTVNLDKWFYFGDNGTDKKSFNLVFSYDMTDAAQELWGVAQGALGDVNTMLADIRDIIDEVNNLLDKVNSYESQITDTVDEYIEKIRGYVDKINSITVKAINNTNQLFQPFMVASTSKGTKRLSGSKGYPTVLTSDVTLFATTQTMELFVPIARKHIAVTNVFKGSTSAQDGNADCIARLKAVNTGRFNTVQDGTERFIQMRGMQSGYVYEIAYSCLDFHGKMATRKYYVTVQ